VRIKRQMRRTTEEYGKQARELVMRYLTIAALSALRWLTRRRENNLATGNDFGGGRVRLLAGSFRDSFFAIRGHWRLT
jgi:hypothetical protein